MTTPARWPPVRLGIAGLGQAGAALIPAILRHDSVVIVAAAEPADEARAAFARDFGVPVYTSIEGLCAEPVVDVVYIATPTPLHHRHTLLALDAVKHVLVEKPMAATLAEADEMVAAAKAAGRHLVVGHSQSFEPAIRTMRDVIIRGEIGRVRMAHTAYYTDWLYRPRIADELDTTLGGGALFRQGIHQVDLLRWLCGGVARSVRASVGDWDAERPGIGSHSLFLEFEDGAVATAVFSGYDHFNSAELTFDVGESGAHIDAEDHAAARKRGAGNAAGRKRQLGYGGEAFAAHTAVAAGYYGLTIVSCEHADIRQTPGGITIYGDQERRDVSIDATTTGRDIMLDEMVAAVRGDAPPAHSGAWGLANLEVCIAALESSRTKSEVRLLRQSPAPG